MKELNKLIPHQSGMIVLDHTGYENFTNWFAGSSSAQSSQQFVPGTGLVQSQKMVGETAEYNQICFTLENERHPALASLPWSQLLPNHLVAHPTFQNLADLWEKLVLNGYHTHCEVIPIQ